MDVRPFEVVIVAHSTRLKELPLICLLQLADISRVSVCVQRHHLLLCCSCLVSQCICNLFSHPLLHPNVQTSGPLFIYFTSYKIFYPIQACKFYWELFVGIWNLQYHIWKTTAWNFQSGNAFSDQFSYWA